MSFFKENDNSHFPLSYLTILFVHIAGSFKILTSNLHSVLHQKRQKEQHHDPDVFVFMDIHAKLGSIKEQEASCFLKWLFCLQGVGVTDPVFWKDNFSSSSTIGGNRNKENIPWKLDVIQKGSLLLYCDVITSQLKVNTNGHFGYFGFPHLFFQIFFLNDILYSRC